MDYNNVERIEGCTQEREKAEHLKRKEIKDLAVKGSKVDGWSDFKWESQIKEPILWIVFWLWEQR